MKACYQKDFRLGILGGGQLGRMLIQEAINLDIRCAVLDPSAEAPCRYLVNEFTQGDLNDFDTVLAFGRKADVLTIEIEHVNVKALEVLEKEGVVVYPSPAILKMVKDKGLQKQFYAENNIASAPFLLVENLDEVAQALSAQSYMQKMRTGGYDGKGVQALRKPEDISKAFNVPSVLEEMVDFEKEIAVIIARNPSGEVSTFPLVEMEFNPEANLVEFLFSPASVSQDIEQKADDLARKVVESLGFVGLLAVEMFVTKSGEVLVNEIAPRPHNSGHHTIECCVTSQYEQHLRAILNLPLGDTSLLQPGVMINLLGEKGYSGPVKYVGLEKALHQPGVYVHLYGKAETKPFRKMGHVTVCNNDLETAKGVARDVASCLKVISN